MKLSNTDVLTHAHAVLKAKARAKRHQVDQIVFDEDARRDYLSGFRKRNLLKKEAAIARAKERDHQQKLEARREHRQALREQAVENAKLVEEAYGNVVGGDTSEDGDFAGFSTEEKGKDREDAYEDAEQLATVTVIDEFDPAALRNYASTSAASLDMNVSAKGEVPPLRPKRRSGEPAAHHAATAQRSTTHGEQLPHASEARSSKIKPKKIAYETKAARKATQQKQRSRKVEKASLAGGKQSRTRQKGGKGKSRK